jgi:iron complex transport system ATP-binding protein
VGLTSDLLWVGRKLGKVLDRSCNAQSEAVPHTLVTSLVKDEFFCQINGNTQQAKAQGQMGSKGEGVAGPRLVARGIAAGYGDAAVLRGIDLGIAPAALTVLVGPNGCGKSTLLKALARVLPPSRGAVHLDGRPIGAIPTRQVARRLALLPQGPVAPEGLTVRELVAQGRYPHQSFLRQWSEADSRAVARALELTALEPLADRPVDSLSGGQRQRAWIAMVLAQDTDIILLDEPTTFLDLKVQVEVMSCLAGIARAGRTLVVVLHELNIAAAFADHLVMMRAGRIVAEGTPADIMTPANLRAVFDLEAQVIADPSSGRPVCIPLCPVGLAA